MSVIDIVRPLDNLPDIWGEGAIFAFSGLDGPKDTLSQFVATFAAEPYNLLIHRPCRRLLTIMPPHAGDVLTVDTPHCEPAVTFAAGIPLWTSCRRVSG